MKDSVNVLAIATAGFAKEVDDVNQYPAEILVAQLREQLNRYLILKFQELSLISQKLAIDSDRKILMPDLLFCES